MTSIQDGEARGRCGAAARHDLRWSGEEGGAARAYRRRPAAFLRRTTRPEQRRGYPRGAVRRRWRGPATFGRRCWAAGRGSRGGAT